MNDTSLERIDLRPLSKTQYIQFNLMERKENMVLDISDCGVVKVHRGKNRSHSVEETGGS